VKAVLYVFHLVDIVIQFRRTPWINPRQGLDAYGGRFHGTAVTINARPSSV